MSTLPQRYLGPADTHIRAGNDGKTRLGVDWLPDRGDLIPGFALIGPETFSCGGRTTTLLVFQHLGFATALREAGLMDGRHPASEFVLVPGRPFAHLHPWQQEAIYNFQPHVAPAPVQATLTRRAFATVPEGLFVDERHQLPAFDPQQAMRAEVARIEVNVPFSDIFPVAEPPPVSPAPAYRAILDSDPPRDSMRHPPLLVARTMLTRAVWQAHEELPPNAGDYAPLVPAGAMSWPRAEAWCARVGMRLPTPSEWHFAARSNTFTRWPHGDDVHELTHYAWVLPQRDRNADTVFQRVAHHDRVVALGPWEVGLLKPNGYGLYDTLGNFSEMCAGERTVAGHLRVRPYVGGAWFCYPEVLTEDNGSVFRPDGSEPFGSYTTGFRPVADVGSRSIRRLCEAGHYPLLYGSREVVALRGSVE